MNAICLFPLVNIIKGSVESTFAIHILTILAFNKYMDCTLIISFNLKIKILYKVIMIYRIYPSVILILELDHYLILSIPSYFLSYQTNQIPSSSSYQFHLEISRLDLGRLVSFLLHLESKL